MWGVNQEGFIYIQTFEKIDQTLENLTNPLRNWPNFWEIDQIFEKMNKSLKNWPNLWKID